MIATVDSVGTPDWWELALSVVPLLAGVLYFAQTRIPSWKARREAEAEERKQAEKERQEHLNRSANGSAPAMEPSVLQLLHARFRTRLQTSNGRSGMRGRAAVEGGPVDRQELTQLEQAAADLSWIGTLLLVEAVLIIFIVLHHFGEITDHYAKLLEQSHYNVTALVLLVIRTAAYGTIVSTALYVLVRFAGASFDQATRFRKRTHSAHVLNFVLAEYEDNITSEKVTLANALEVFKAWNENVQSAFTAVKLVKDKQETVTGSVSPSGGATFNYGAPVRELASRAVAGAGKDAR